MVINARLFQRIVQNKEAIVVTQSVAKIYIFYQAKLSQNVLLYMPLKIETRPVLSKSYDCST